MITTTISAADFSVYRLLYGAVIVEWLSDTLIRVRYPGPPLPSLEWSAWDVLVLENLGTGLTQAYTYRRLPPISGRH